MTYKQYTTNSSWSEMIVLSSDIAVMDEDGFGAIVGRMKDCVIRGGENIYPTEIEQFLYKHPVVEDVQVGYVHPLSPS